MLLTQLRLRITGYEVTRVIEMKKQTHNNTGRNVGIALAIVFGTLAFFAGGWIVIPILLGLVGVLLVGLALASPFLVLGFGIYGMVHLVQQRQRQIPLVPAHGPATQVPYQLVPPHATPIPSAPATVPAPVAVAPPAIAAAAAPPTPNAELPTSIRTKVQQIEHRANELLARSGPGALAGEDRALAQRALSDYLPQALKAYRALPPGSGDWAVTAGGKTGVQMLEEQLELIEQSLRQIEVRIWRSGAEQMLAQQRFLEQRFGDPKPGDDQDELRLPPS
jgi:hypothetical protein